MRHGEYYSIDTAPNYDGEPITLDWDLTFQNEEDSSEKFFV